VRLGGVRSRMAGRLGIDVKTLAKRLSSDRDDAAEA
jgi:hypothetical protein